MKFGDVQAVVQLAVALNVGISALHDLSVPYLLRQRSDLRALRESLRAAQEGSHGDDEASERRRKSLLPILGEVMRVMRASTQLRREMDRFIQWMAWFAGFFAVVSLAYLFAAAHNYDDTLSSFAIALAYACYLPLLVVVVINLIARSRGRSLVQDQERIRQDARAII